VNQSDSREWRQHFPTYHFSDRDIVLKEYESAVRAYERVFVTAVNVSIVIAAALASLAIGSIPKLAVSLSPIVPSFLTHGFVLLLGSGISYLLIREFADRRKAIVFSARTVIVLRRMLGMSYGTFRLVLPNWRLEGADEPFAIRLFPGWNTQVAYPCILVAGLFSLLAF